MANEFKYSNKFLNYLHEVANNFVHHIADESNNNTIKRGKMKIMPIDIFESSKKYDFTEDEITEIKKKLKEFEETE